MGRLELRLMGRLCVIVVDEKVDCLLMHIIHAVFLLHPGRKFLLISSHQKAGLHRAFQVAFIINYLLKYGSYHDNFWLIFSMLN